MHIHVAHLNCKDDGHYFITNFCIYFRCFCRKTVLSVFFGKEIHKIVDICSNES